jgi:UDP-2,3-diacylglucosamine pyrophosphatase LpxH
VQGHLLKFPQSSWQKSLPKARETFTRPGPESDTVFAQGHAAPAHTVQEVTVLDAVLLSDLHLGADACQVRALHELIENLPDTTRLILVGDVLESSEHRLTKQHWKVLSLLRKLSDRLALVWVQGNHDFDAESVAHLIGAEFVPEYSFQSGDRELLCVHGDAWDRFLTDHPIIVNICDWFYLRMQRMSRRLALGAKRRSKTFVRCVERVRTEALEYARAKRADVVICGHTHIAEALPDPAAPDYYNTGCWTDHHCHYITVADGVVRLEEINVDVPCPELTPEQVG